MSDLQLLDASGSNVHRTNWLDRLPSQSFLVIIVILSFAMRFAISWYSIGSNDSVTWKSFGRIIVRDGLFQAYEKVHDLNHPPIPATWAAFVFELEKDLNIPFSFLFRLLPIIADLLTSLVLWNITSKRFGKRTGWVVVASYACCLNAILVSAYHCNTDSIYAFLSLLAVYYIEEQRSFSRAGLAIAAAINIKLIPVLLIMPLYALCRSRRDFMKFNAGLAIGVLPFIPPIFLVREAFITHVIKYNPGLNLWGTTFIVKLLASCGVNMWEYLTYYVSLGRYVIILAIAILSLLAWRLRAWNGYELAAMGMAMFLILTPGFGVQYTIAVTPLLFAANIRMGICYGFLAGLFLLIIYWQFWTGGLPAYSHFNSWFHMPSPWLGLAAYLLLVVFVATTCCAGIRRSKKQEQSDR